MCTSLVPVLNNTWKGQTFFFFKISAIAVDMKWFVIVLNGFIGLNVILLITTIFIYAY